MTNAFDDDDDIANPHGYAVVIRTYTRIPPACRDQVRTLPLHTCAVLGVLTL